MRVQRVQLIFHFLCYIQGIVIVQVEPPILIVAQCCNKFHILGRLFRRYFLQIFDLRAFCFFHIHFIVFLTCVDLRPFYGPFLADALFFSFPIRFLCLFVRIRPFLIRFPWILAHFRPILWVAGNCTKRTFPFQHGNNLCNHGNFANQYRTHGQRDIYP